MRKDVKKFLFIGSQDEQERFFKNAQEMGIIQFINPHLKTLKDIPEDVQNLTLAIKVLRGLPTADQEENYHALDADLIVDQILHLHRQIEQNNENIRLLTLDISKINVWEISH